ncbi:MAG: hypothetical protein SVV67_07600 [Bacillota bacterium]|nr:hypothetical protein [Bacillota bacterium]
MHAPLILSLIVGAAISHNFGLASSHAGVTTGGMVVVGIGMVVCLLIGFTMRGKVA